jgi:hypothetical protein
MRRVESTAIRAYSFNARRQRLTIRFENDGSTYRYYLAVVPPEHNGEDCAICHLTADEVMAAFEGAESKGHYYNAVLRRGHFLTERSRNWRRVGRVRALSGGPAVAPSVVDQPRQVASSA